MTNNVFLDRRKTALTGRAYLKCYEALRRGDEALSDLVASLAFRLEGGFVFRRWFTFRNHRFAIHADVLRCGLQLSGRAFGQRMRRRGIRPDRFGFLSVAGALSVASSACSGMGIAVFKDLLLAEIITSEKERQSYKEVSL